ncbi:hypothetical protein [Akkermansia muciniphila]|uniref:hypothetical protein n=1 Tax=Akkermansia muciniphila TaxID=239935 RepID=UPI000C9C6C8D|nr:hypothetical protein [Akkermansia muciniphila]PNC90981.1 hypothetical protein CXT91_09140 [Akkermansia muciniphila]
MSYYIPHILEIVFGFILGYSVFCFNAFISNRKVRGNNIEMSGSVINGKVAGRDINETIQNIGKAISRIENATITQKESLENIKPLKTNGKIDLFIVEIPKIYHFNNEFLTEELESLIDTLNIEGWSFQQIQFMCHNDFDIAIFEKPAENKLHSKVFFERRKI